MPEKWTGALVGKMHNNGIKQVELAEKMHYTNAYVGMILRGERKPPNIRKKMESAVNELIAEKNSSTTVNEK